MPFDNANVPESKTTRVLKKARELITPANGWCAFIRQDGMGARCALGALGAAIGLHAGNYGQHTEATALLAKHVSSKGRRPDWYTDTNWNEYLVAHHNNEKGHEATLAMFDAAITDSMALDAQAALA